MYFSAQAWGIVRSFIRKFTYRTALGRHFACKFTYVAQLLIPPREIFRVNLRVLHKSGMTLQCAEIKGRVMNLKFEFRWASRKRYFLIKVVIKKSHWRQNPGEGHFWGLLGVFLAASWEAFFCTGMGRRKDLSFFVGSLERIFLHRRGAS